jgi:hypothetical protein
MAGDFKILLGKNQHRNPTYHFLQFLKEMILRTKVLKMIEKVNSFCWLKSQIFYKKLFTKLRRQFKFIKRKERLKWN